MPSKRDLGLRVRCVFTDQDSVLRSRLSALVARPNSLGTLRASNSNTHTRLINILPKQAQVPHLVCIRYYVYGSLHKHSTHTTVHHSHTHTPSGTLRKNKNTYTYFEWHSRHTLSARLPYHLFFTFLFTLVTGCCFTPFPTDHPVVPTDNVLTCVTTHL